jgi:peptide/nickel transport system ATP-binding protein
MTIGRTLEEPIAIHALPRAEALTRLSAILKRLGLSSDVLAKFPHQIFRRAGAPRRRRPRASDAPRNHASPTSRRQGSTSRCRASSELCCSTLQREFGLTYLLVSHN